MQLESGKIPANQLFSILVCFLFGSTIIIAPAIQAGKDAWLVMLSSMLVGMLLATIYIILAQRFPAKNLMEINDLVYGPWLGKAISIIYLWYFLQLASFVLRDFGDFLTGIDFPSTPISVFLILIALISASAVRNGIEVIGRIAILLMVFTVMTVLIITFLNSPQMDFNNLFPILKNTPLKDFFFAVHASTTFPFGETVVFLMIFAFINNPRKLKKTTLGAFLFAGIILTIVVIRNVTIAGNLLKNYTYLSYIVVRSVEIFYIITRIEILVLINFLTMGFLKISTLYYAVVLGTSQILKLRSYLPLVLPIGVIMICLSFFQFKNSFENLHFANEIYPYYVLPFQVFLPLITLLVAIIRGKKGTMV